MSMESSCVMHIQFINQLVNQYSRTRIEDSVNTHQSRLPKIGGGILLLPQSVFPVASSPKVTDQCMLVT